MSLSTYRCPTESLFLNLFPPWAMAVIDLGESGTGCFESESKFGVELKAR